MYQTIVRVARKKMQNKKAYMSSNAVIHDSPVPTWPPPWLVKAREAAKSNPLPQLEPDLPELAAWDEITIEEAAEPCPKCGSLEIWWDFDNKPHCQQCRPIRRALALADLAARIRSRKR
jgi:hypothetical protein